MAAGLKVSIGSGIFGRKKSEIVLQKTVVSMAQFIGMEERRKEYGGGAIATNFAHYIHRVV